MFPIFLINFLLAISTTVGMTIIPFLVTDSLGLSLFLLGLLEGSTEFLSNALRLINGILFDKIKNKRLLFVLSTGIAFLAKVFLLFPSPWTILFSKTFERAANGAFASPRDAYVGENAKNKGLAFGFLGVSKTAGCIIGPLLVSGSTFILGDLKNNMHFIIMLCCLLILPAFIMSFLLNVKKVEKSPFSFQEMGSIGRKIIPILFLIFLFFLARFNDGLLMIHLKQKGFPEWFYLSTIAIFNGIMLITSPIIGSQIDHGKLNRMLYVTIGALIIFNLCFFQINDVMWLYAILGLIAWGIQRSGAQIVFACFIFKSVPKANYGTAIGLCYLMSGIATMFSSFLCGYIANNYMLSFIFLFSGMCSVLALVFSIKVLKGLVPDQSLSVSSIQKGVA